MDTLHKLHEEHMKAKEKISLHHNCIKRWFYWKSTGNANFVVGDLVLKWDKPLEDKGKHMKFQSLSTRPFTTYKKLGQHIYRLQLLEGRIDNLPVNG